MRDAVTTWLELAGLLLLAAAAAVYVARWTVAGALGTGGALLIAVSMLITARRPKG